MYKKNLKTKYVKNGLRLFIKAINQLKKSFKIILNRLIYFKDIIF